MLEIKKECTGCMACVNGCPIGAIRIKKDEFGFVMPDIDIEACIDCGQCENVCPINGLPEGQEKEDAILSGKWKSEPMPIAAWSMFHMDEKVVEKSSSGGAFYALAKAVLEGGMSGNHTVTSQNDGDISTVCGRTAQNDEHKVCDNSNQSIDADIVCDKTSHQTGIVFGCLYDIGSRSAYLTDTDHVSLDSLL
ncbi:MAG: 4Fe-4S dicluster domain-containing protein, partial [Eubacterium sp.]|nr:4Fe-4S dicluster domain-containing protein [Eubacterium sp.]